MKKDICWLIDTQIIKDDALQRIRDSIESNQFNIKEINLKDNHIFSVPLNEIVIPYGSTHLIKYFLNNSFSNVKLFFNEENFKTQKWNEKLGQRMLNHDAQFCQLKDVFSLNLPDLIFIKPDSDLKSFTGSIVRLEGLTRFYNKIKNKDKEFNFDLSLPVVINSVKNTGWEWRLFMIKNEVIAASSYKLKEMLNLNKQIPKEALQFAIDSSLIWHPDEVYVLDVCETDSGYKIVEFNCFHASGLYNCDISEIITRISKFA